MTPFSLSDPNQRRAAYERWATEPAYTECPQFWIDKALKDDWDVIREWAARKLQDFPCLPDRVHWAAGTLEDSNPGVQQGAMDSLRAIAANSSDPVERARAAKIVDEQTLRKTIGELQEQVARLTTQIGYLHASLDRCKSPDFVQDSYNIAALALLRHLINPKHHENGKCPCESNLNSRNKARQMEAIARVVKECDRRCLMALFRTAEDPESDLNVRLAALSAFADVSRRQAATSLANPEA